MIQHPLDTMSTERKKQLQDRVASFCAAFLDLPNNPPEKILSEHFTSAHPEITEHGPDWARDKLPFLGHTFTGHARCIDYFSLLSETLEFLPSEDTFPSKEGFIVDPEGVGPVDRQHGRARGLVSVVGRARFKAVRTGRSWEERFIYRLSGFDEDGKIGHWEIWADPLSAWMSVQDEPLK